jgi:hypothetical protein
MQFDQTNILPEKTVDFGAARVESKRCPRRKTRTVNHPHAGFESEHEPSKSTKAALPAPMIWHVDKVNMNC